MLAPIEARRNFHAVVLDSPEHRAAAAKVLLLELHAPACLGTTAMARVVDACAPSRNDFVHQIPKLVSAAHKFDGNITGCRAG